MAYRPKMRAKVRSTGTPTSSNRNVMRAAVRMSILAPRLHVDVLRLLVELQPDIPQVGVENGRACAMQLRQLRREQLERLHLGLGLEGLDLDGALRLLDLLIGGRLRQADVARNLIVRRVDRGESRLHLRRRIDSGDQRGIELDAVTRRRRTAFLIHVLVEVAQIFAQIVDGNASYLDGRR